MDNRDEQWIVDKLDKSSFLLWLKQRPLSDIVGVTCDMKGCPIYNFLAEEIKHSKSHKHLKVNVNREEVTVFERLDSQPQYIDSPYWVSEFVGIADDMAYDLSQVDERFLHWKVTAKKAIDILGDVK